MADEPVEIASIQLVISASSTPLDIATTSADLDVVQSASIDLDIEAS
jgi:hypothetical protein